MFEITGPLTQEDYYEFADFHMKNSKNGKKALGLFRWLIPVALLCWGLMVRELELFGYGLWIVVTPLSIVWIIFAAKLFSLIQRQKVQKALNEKDTGEVFKERSYIFDDSGIESKTAHSSTKCEWQAIVDMAESDSAFYLYISSLQAYVILKKYIGNEDDITRFRHYVMTKKNCKA